MNRSVLIVYGTRPEAIKLAPLVTALERSGRVRPVVAVTGQHRHMLDQVNQLFGINPKHDLDLIADRQSLESLTSRALEGVSRLIAAERPDAIVVQGDTTSCFAAALAGFYQRTPVIHLEAGLRTGDSMNPFPEEINRRLTTRLSALHLAPTGLARQHLLDEGVDPDAVVVTGNTVIDALLEVSAADAPLENQDLVALVAELGPPSPDRPLLLVTAHRRESWGQPMACLAEALADLARRFPTLRILLPAHLNPIVREVLIPPLAGLTNVTVTEPLNYSDFARALGRASVVLTDSGGVQEEAPSLGKPVLVTRETTERPEAVSAGTVRLVGTDTDTIVRAVAELLTDPDAYAAMANAVNPYGDGRAALRAAAAIEHYFGLNDRLEDFQPRAGVHHHAVG